MNKKLFQILLNTVLIVVTVVIITILLVKRFGYFRPSNLLLKTQNIYKIYKVQHLFCWIKEQNNEKVIVFCSDRIGNMSHYEKDIINLTNIGYTVIVFDYSGFGKSGGLPSETKLFEDVSIIINHTLKKYSKENIIICGKGLGSCIAAYGARRYGLSKIILISPIESIKNVFKKNILRILNFMFKEFDIKLYLDGYKGKTILIYNKIDYGSVKDILNLTEINISLKNKEKFPHDRVKHFCG